MAKSIAMGKLQCLVLSPHCQPCLAKWNFNGMASCSSDATDFSRDLSPGLAMAQSATAHLALPKL